MAAYTSSTILGAPTRGTYATDDTFTDAAGKVFFCVRAKKGSTPAQWIAYPPSISAAEANVVDGVTAGTVTASKAVVVGTSKDVDTLLINIPAVGIETGLTAHVGGGQASALALSTSKAFHRVTTVGTAADSVKLPAATGSGNVHIVANDAASNSLQVYGSGTDTIDAVATGTGVAIAAAKLRIFVDYAAGTWVSILGA